MNMKNLIVLSLLCVVVCVYAQYPYYGGYYGYSTYYPTPTYPTTNYNSYGGYGDMNQVFNQLMDITIQQVNAQQAQYEQVQNNLINVTVQQVEQQNRAEYNEFCKYVKKPDGSNYSFEEFMYIKATMHSEEHSNDSETYSTSSSSGQCPRCKGTGNCKHCKGTGRVYDYGPMTLVTKEKYDQRCGVCEGSGDCGVCDGKGRIN